MRIQLSNYHQPKNCSRAHLENLALPGFPLLQDAVHLVQSDVLHFHESTRHWNGLNLVFEPVLLRQGDLDGDALNRIAVQCSEWFHQLGKVVLSKC